MENLKEQIRLLKELVKCLKEFNEANAYHQYKLAYKINEKGKIIESELAALDKPDTGKELLASDDRCPECGNYPEEIEQIAEGKVSDMEYCVQSFIRSQHLTRQWDEFRDTWFKEEKPEGKEIPADLPDISEALELASKKSGKSTTTRNREEIPAGAEEILLAKCSENKVFLTSNEIHTIIEAMLEYSRLRPCLVFLQRHEEPSDYDIENAACEYATEINKIGGNDMIITKSYIQGAKDMRANNIFISPSEGKSYTEANKQQKSMQQESQSRKEKVFDFVVKHKTDCYRAFKASTNYKGMDTTDGSKLIEMARKEIGYSSKTWDGDIYRVLFKTYTAITIHGANTPEEL